MIIKKILSAFLIIFIFLTTLCSCAPNKNQKTSSSSFVLNTVATITVYGTEDEQIIAKRLKICQN